mmetsp:Transcript_43448/g.112506  ORF Transcript_43448/g.112506 Transcript_43448/m.112506 type:complete len:219 (+) Transcript_43448:2041-2697(+)
MPRGRHLQRGDAAPGAAHREHVAAAPRLRSRPLHHRARIGLLQGAVFVVKEAAAVAGAAAVHAHARDAVAGEVGPHERVHLRAAVALAVRQHLHRHGAPVLPAAAAHDGQPHPRRQLGAIAHGDPGVGHLVHVKRHLVGAHDAEVRGGGGGGQADAHRRRRAREGDVALHVRREVAQHAVLHHVREAQLHPARQLLHAVHQLHRQQGVAAEAEEAVRG